MDILWYTMLAVKNSDNQASFGTALLLKLHHLVLKEDVGEWMMDPIKIPWFRHPGSSWSLFYLVRGGSRPNLTEGSLSVSMGCFVQGYLVDLGGPRVITVYPAVPFGGKTAGQRTRRTTSLLARECLRMDPTSRRLPRLGEISGDCNPTTLLERSLPNDFTSIIESLLEEDIGGDHREKRFLSVLEGGSGRLKEMDGLRRPSYNWFCHELEREEKNMGFSTVKFGGRIQVDGRKLGWIGMVLLACSWDGEKEGLYLLERERPITQS
ncbi:hypothetical protein M5K25_012691 [Dendrobium thyrsiflorum]|uniref:Uncharacterized protein n=1 Tax=Dendrobium thyrsiflorum TaxID=117978 RepID=A0ABD0V4S9_DENTH